MRLFLDTSVLLSASGSAEGASRFIVAEAVAQGWDLVSSDYCAEETQRNLPKIGRTAATAWKAKIAPRVRLIRASLALDKPLLFPKAKDRPVVITALAARASPENGAQRMGPGFVVCGLPFTNRSPDKSRRTPRKGLPRTRR